MNNKCPHSSSNHYVSVKVKTITTTNLWSVIMIARAELTSNVFL